MSLRALKHLARTPPKGCCALKSYREYESKVDEPALSLCCDVSSSVHVVSGTLVSSVGLCPDPVLIPPVSGWVKQNGGDSEPSLDCFVNGSCPPMNSTILRPALGFWGDDPGLEALGFDLGLESGESLSFDVSIGGLVKKAVGDSGNYQLLSCFVGLDS